MNDGSFRDDAIAAHLRDLPEPPAPPDLWPRIERSHRGRRQRRLALRGGLALGAALLLWQQMPTAPLPAPDAAQAGPSTPPALRTLDRRLQAAYEQGAEPTALAPLWRDREILLMQLQDPGVSDEHILRL